jgi:hypothetical protein
MMWSEAFPEVMEELRHQTYTGYLLVIVTWSKELILFIAIRKNPSEQI